jgi:ATP-dependent DNA ligase
MDGGQRGRVRRAGGIASLAVGPDTPPMEAKLAESLPDGPGWQFEPKWDGFRCLAFRAGAEVDLRAKSGKPLARYFPDMVAALAALPPDRFVIDGELVIPAERRLSFEHLQLRLHPAASRVAKLAGENPALLILFDMLLAPSGESLLDATLPARRAALERFYASLGDTSALRLSPFTRDRKQAMRWLAHASGTLDGVIAKPLDAPYQAGERAMIKVKRQRTADCVVGGFRYAQDSAFVGSLLLGLYDRRGKLHHVGFTSTITHAERQALTKRLETLIAPPGFTGDAPGGPSRWSTARSGEWQPLKPELVVEVRYDQVTGGRFRHGTKLLRWRPDKAPHQCRCDQIAPATPPKLLGEMLR